MLQKQNVSIAINAPIDTKADPFLTDAQSFLAQENVRFEKTGAIVKRDGLLVTPALSQNGHEIISDGQRRFVLGDAGRSSIQKFTSSWNDLDEVDSVAQAKLKLVETFGGDGNAITAYSSELAGQRAIIVDTNQEGAGVPAAIPVLYIQYSTGGTASFKGFTYATANDVLVLPKTCYFGAGASPLILASCYYGTGASNFMKYAVVTQAGVLVAQNDVAIAGITTHASIGIPGTGVGAIFVRQGANTLRIISVNDAGANTVTDLTTSTAIDQVVDVSLDIGSPGSPLHVLAIKTDGYPVVIAIDPATYTITYERAESNATLGLGTLTTGTGSGGITSIGNDYHYTYSTTQDTTLLVRTNYIKGNSSSSSILNYDFWVRATTRPLFYGDKVFCGLRGAVPSATAGTVFQSTYVAQINATSSPQRFSYVAAFNQNTNEAANYDFVGGSINNGVISMMDRAALRREGARTDLLYTSFTSILENAAELYEVYVSTSRRQQGSVLTSNRSLLSFAGAPSFFDNVSSRKASIIFPASIMKTTLGSVGGGGLAAGTYLYRVYFDVIDDQGQKVFGQVSPQVSVTVVSSPNDSVQIEIPLNTSLGMRTRVTLCRTKAGGTVFFVAKRQIVDSSVSSIALTDFTPDSSILDTTPLLYTTGGILSASPIPPALHACSHNNRVFVVPADEFNKVYYSKTLLENEYPQFSDFLFLEQFSILPTKDKIQAIGSIDDKLVILRESSIYWISGDGANDTGSGATFSEPELLSADIGCLEPKSVIKTAVGLFFKSSKGIYMIDSGLSVKYVGAPVEAYNSEVIYGASSNPSQNLVMFITANRVMVYNYFFDRWSIDTVAGVESMAVSESLFFVCRSNQVSRYTGASADSVTPSTTNIMKVVTGWIKLSGLQDFARIYRLLILGRRVASHVLTVNVYYDYDDTIFETFTITPDPAQGIYQFKLHLRRQKCESIKIEIMDDGGGKKCEITGITLEVGIKKGSAKINTARQY
jgi:hypothetical protein